MKLKIYDSSLNEGATTKRTPCINVCPRNGSFSLNKSAMELTGFKTGDFVSLVNDEDAPDDWYIVKDPKGFMLKSKENSKGEPGTLIFRCTALATIVVSSLKLPEASSYSILMAGQPTKIDKNTYWGVLMISARAVKRVIPKK